MTTASVDIHVLLRQGRWDAAYTLLKHTHKELSDVLASALSEQELEKLAADLPFDVEAANLIWKRNAATTITKDGMLKYTKKPEPDDTSLAARRYHKDHVALYCAAASQYGLSKALQEIYVLAELKLKMLKTIQEYVALSERPGLELLGTALKRSSETDAASRQVQS